MNRSRFIVAALSAALLPVAALAQTDWPTKPISMVVPYPPGGVNDAVARVYAEKLSGELGKPVIVDNRAGAATTVASNFVAKAAPDGYTIYAGGTSLVINPTLTGQVQYDPHKSFELVSLMSFTPFILHVNADFPAKNMAELIAIVKANPGKFNIASSGVGATNHLAAELLKVQAGLQLVHVPYKGGAQAGQDVAGGQAQMMFSASLEAKPLLASGRTRAIAISSQQRSPAFPDIPTVVESTGLKDFEVVFWQGMVVPAGTPQPIVDLLHREVVKMTAQPDYAERLAALGLEPVANTPQQFDALLRSELPKWAKVIAEAKMQKVD
jgi:tripartite-type tricarboxylate transporter receptor subunit TctC